MIEISDKLDINLESYLLFGLITSHNYLPYPIYQVRETNKKVIDGQGSAPLKYELGIGLRAFVCGGNKFSIDDWRTILDVNLTGALIKAVIQDWYLKRWKYRKLGVNVEQYTEFVISFVMDSIAGK